MMQPQCIEQNLSLKIEYSEWDFLMGCVDLEEGFKFEICRQIMEIPEDMAYLICLYTKPAWDWIIQFIQESDIF